MFQHAVSDHVNSVRRHPRLLDVRCNITRPARTISTTSPFSSVAEWLACWTQTQNGLGLNRSRVTVRQTVHTHCASVHQEPKLVAALLRVAGVTAGVAESNGNLPPGL